VSILSLSEIGSTWKLSIALELIPKLLSAMRTSGSDPAYSFSVPHSLNGTTYIRMEPAFIINKGMINQNGMVLIILIDLPSMLHQALIRGKLQQGYAHRDLDSDVDVLMVADDEDSTDDELDFDDLISDN